MALHPHAISAVTEVFRGAQADGRNTLHEYEVYRMLQAIGLDAPRHAFVRDIHEVDQALLDSLAPGPLIVKTVSRDLAHNQRYGGVKKVDNPEPLFVRFVLDSMRAEVLSHFPGDQQPAIDGFLLVEFVKFTQALGNEIMIGLKADPAFGPVVTLTKGGDDAEFFAKYYDPANLLLAPVTLEDARDIVGQLKIGHKFHETGHGDYLEKIARAVSAIGDLGYAFSFSAEQLPGFQLGVLDINPLVFSADGRFLAVDGYAEFQPCEPCAAAPHRPDASNLSAFFAPRGVAVLGVSSDAGKYSMARIIVQLFRDLGREDVYCVNPRGGEAVIGGASYPLYKSLDDIPDHVDLVVYAAPAKHTLDFIRTLPEGKAAILISGIPPEIRYSEFAAAVDAGKPAGVRLIGPNCMGVYRAPGEGSLGVNTLFIEDSRLHIPRSPHSNVALFTQSGAMGITLIERAQHSRIIRTIVSFGNKVDVNVPDLMSYFDQDNAIDVMSMYMEGIDAGEGRQFFDIARETKKPVIVYKSGRTEAGAKAAASHTASMSGSYDVFRACCLQAGCVLTEELDDFYNFTKAFAMLYNKRPGGRRVAGVVNAGLDATMGADTLNCLSQAVLQPETVAKIRALNTHGLVDTNTSFLDVTPMTDDVLYAQFIEAVLADPGVDCLFVGIVPHVETLKTIPENCKDPDALASLLIDIGRRSGKPIVVSINAGQHFQAMVQYAEENGLPVYADIRSAIRSLDAYVAWSTAAR